MSLIHIFHQDKGILIGLLRHIRGRSAATDPASEQIEKDGKKPDSNFFVNEYARVGDKSWSIMDLQEEIDKEALEAEIDFSILKIPESPSNDELRELCRKFYEKGRAKERKR